MATLNTILNSDEWDDAYEKVEHYLLSLKIQNRRIISKLVYLILEEAAAKVKEKPDLNPTVIAIDEAHNLTSAWCEKVMGTKFTQGHGIPVKGRIAMLLADIPDKWLKYFLTDGPWPEEFTDAMQKAYLSSGPEFQSARMRHRALELTPAGSILAETFKFVNRRPYLTWLIYSALAILFICLFFFTR